MHEVSAWKEERVLHALLESVKRSENNNQSGPVSTFDCAQHNNIKAPHKLKRVSYVTVYELVK